MYKILKIFLISRLLYPNYLNKNHDLHSTVEWRQCNINSDMFVPVIKEKYLWQTTYVCLWQATCLCLWQATCLWLWQATCVFLYQATCLCLWQAICLCLWQATWLCLWQVTCLCPWQARTYIFLSSGGISCCF